MWPTISNINRTIESTIKSYSTDSMKASNLNAWIRVYSGATTSSNQGLIMQSNTDFKLFSAAGEGDSIYGTTQSAGVIGRDWNGKPVIAETGRGFRPSPVITSFNSKEGQDQISRTCDFSITCFSLQQLEKIQTYFMEPGYSVAVEWGWNTVNSAEGLVNTKNGPGGILKEIADTTLNNGSLSAKRFNTNGEYDIFLGFIVGSTVSNDGENFKVDVKLRGTPSLPTYLQSHNRITKTEENTTGTIDAEKSKTGFGPNELINADVAKRRFKAMFNELPSFRQTLAVKELEKLANLNDYINFDKVITDSIDVFRNQTKGFIFKSRQTSIKVVGEDIGGEVEIDKEKLFSQNRYIRFGLAIDILNEIGSLEEYKIGDKRVSFKLDINNSVIGAFPNMFSTKATKLIITGKIPDFSIYFLNSAEVSQNSNGNLADKQPERFPASESFVQFVERNDDLNKFGLRENAGYYGYLKNLFVNFDMFKSKIEQKNKTIREILLDILNEMSSAVNGFWNYQIVESEFKKSNETATNELREIAPFVAAPQQQTFNSAGSGPFGFGQGVNVTPTLSNSTGLNLESGDIVITVVDENWIGQNPDPDPNNIVKFQHSGIGSPFLNSTLDISIPSDKAGQIIAKRLGNDSQPDSANIKIGGLFNAQTDLFLPKSDTTETDNTTEQTVADASVDETVLTPTEETRVQEIGNEIGALNRDNFAKFFSEGFAAGTQEENEKRKRILEAERDRINQRVKVAKEATKAAAEAAKEAARGRLTTFLDKIDIVPIPTIEAEFVVTEATLKSLINTNLCIFCYDDTDFFDAMKNHYFKKNEGSSLSHPLPIKYSFTILGNSGIRRGDTFKITGIPEKYADSGIFQVTEVEHSLSDMKWETSVTGQYRQIK